MEIQYNIVMKQSKPNIKAIKAILNDKSICGYNDKRQNGGRIKLISRLSHMVQRKLETALAIQYPDYQIACGNIIWRRCYITTAIHFKLKRA